MAAPPLPAADRVPADREAREDFSDDVAELLGKYEVRALIGEGQYGRVYEGLGSK